jgi:hypothetical protein
MLFDMIGGVGIMRQPITNGIQFSSNQYFIGLDRGTLHVSFALKSLYIYIKHQEMDINELEIVNVCL